MGFGRRRNAHDISVPSPTDNAHGGDWRQGKSGPGSAAPAVTGQPLDQSQRLLSADSKPMGRQHSGGASDQPESWPVLLCAEHPADLGHAPGQFTCKLCDRQSVITGKRERL